jgi:hypothetical protein
VGRAWQFTLIEICLHATPRTVAQGDSARQDLPMGGALKGGFPTFAFPDSIAGAYRIRLGFSYAKDGDRLVEPLPAGQSWTPTFRLMDPGR